MPKGQDGSLKPAQSHLVKALVKDRMNRNLDKHDLLGNKAACLFKGGS